VQINHFGKGERVPGEQEDIFSRLYVFIILAAKINK
jgi:hypothetical protein